MAMAASVILLVTARVAMALPRQSDELAVGGRPGKHEAVRRHSSIISPIDVALEGLLDEVDGPRSSAIFSAALPLSGFHDADPDDGASPSRPTLGEPPDTPTGTTRVHLGDAAPMHQSAGRLARRSSGGAAPPAAATGSASRPATP